MLPWSQMTREDYEGKTAPLFDVPAPAGELGGQGSLFAPNRWCIIACGGAKLDHMAPARELYTGQMFRQTLAAAEAVAGDGGRVLILSALWGLVELDQPLMPYNVKMGANESVPEILLRHQASKLGIGAGAEVLAFMPRRYMQALDAALRPLGVHPVNVYEGCRGIGEQRHVNAQLIAGHTEPEPELADRLEAAEAAEAVLRAAGPTAETVLCWCCAQYGIQTDAALGRSTCVGCAMRSPSHCKKLHEAEARDNA